VTLGQGWITRLPNPRPETPIIDSETKGTIGSRNIQQTVDLKNSVEVKKCIDKLEALRQRVETFLTL
jgi:hypothetical protein